MQHLKMKCSFEIHIELLFQEYINSLYHFLPDNKQVTEQRQGWNARKQIYITYMNSIATFLGILARSVLNALLP